MTLNHDRNNHLPSHNTVYDPATIQLSHPAHTRGHGWIQGIYPWFRFVSGVTNDLFVPKPP